jgi:hypothetical protein
LPLDTFGKESFDLAILFILELFELVFGTPLLHLRCAVKQNCSPRFPLRTKYYETATALSRAEWNDLIGEIASDPFTSANKKDHLFRLSDGSCTPEWELTRAIFQCLLGFVICGPGRDGCRHRDLAIYLGLTLPRKSPHC